MKLHDGREVALNGREPTAKRYNVYECPGPADESSGPHALLSMDVDDGATPMFVRCPDHGSTSVSQMYRLAVPPSDFAPVRMVWRKATKSELKAERRDGGWHFAKGGLQREWAP